MCHRGKELLKMVALLVLQHQHSQLKMTFDIKCSSNLIENVIKLV